MNNQSRGGAAVARRPHKPEVAGSNPALASISPLAGRYRLQTRSLQAATEVAFPPRGSVSLAARGFS